MATAAVRLPVNRAGAGRGRRCPSAPSAAGRSPPAAWSTRPRAARATARRAAGAEHARRERVGLVARRDGLEEARERVDGLGGLELQPHCHVRTPVSTRKKNTKNKFPQSEQRLFINFGGNKYSHYMH